MDSEALEKLRYPIGKFVVPRDITSQLLTTWINSLESLPDKLAALVVPLSDEELDKAYRPGGWTIRQVVHHIADSHHHSYTRFKWALTEDQPLIKAYEEKDWANLFDSRTAPIQLSLDHLSAVHKKLVFLIRGLSEAQLSRSFIHPDGNVKTPLAENIGRYAWHGEHHLAHIANAL